MFRKKNDYWEFGYKCLDVITLLYSNALLNECHDFKTVLDLSFKDVRYVYEANLAKHVSLSESTKWHTYSKKQIIRFQIDGI